MAATSSRGFGWMIALGGFLISLSAFTYLYFNIDQPAFRICPSGHRETRHDLTPYPEEIIAETKLVTFNGAFYGEEENIYRASASPDVDQAWRDLGISIGPLHIAEEDGPAMLIPEDRFKVEDEKLGSSYLATIEVFHQIHCLDLLRKSLWFNADYYIGLGEHEFGNSEKVLQDHVTHCLDMLRQVLMCNSDVGVVPQKSIELHDGSMIPFPDFSRPHQCRNYDAIKNWAEENAHEHWEDTHPMPKTFDV